MRRKSERTSTKKTKASPEKKVEKLKRTRRGRRKQSNSSDNESADESIPVQEMETVSKPESKPQSPAKEDSPEDAADQVWRVKAAEGSDDVGEIKKLKICLTRPPSTPERVDRSPRSKRKHSRATSSSDTTSVEGVDEKKKSKHRSKKQSKDKDEKGHDSHGEEIEGEPEQQESDKSSNEVSQSDTTTNECEKKETETAEVPMSTTDEDTKTNEGTSDANEGTEQPEQSVETDEQQSQKTSDADTTVVSPKDETRVVSPSGDNPNTSEKTPERKRSLSVDKSEILELHPEDSKCESDNETVKPKEDVKDEPTAPEETTSREKQVSTIEEAVNKDSQSGSNKIKETDVVETSKTEDREERKTSVDSAAANETDNVKEKEVKEHETHPKTIERSDSTQSVQDPVSNGPPAASVVSRKRRWGSRSNKLTTQKSITISTDVLKEIIPDVKPTEFEEVIEEKKHKRIEIPEKERVERPLLPKIVIDNSENIEKRHEVEEKDTAKVKESHLSSNRKISIVKENESIIARPPSPPRHKQSNILYITNLVRPFTLQQLKNLLQRTGRIVDDGFWMDKIKSKCFVKYKSEEQAVETRHALHGVRWPVSNPKTLQVDFSTEEAFDKAKSNEDADNAQVSTMPGTVEDWLWEQDMKRERGELDKPWERKASTREWDLGKNEKDKDKDKMRREEPRPIERRRQRSIEKSPEPARKFKKKEEEAPAKLLDDLFRKTKATPCIYWLPLSAETIAVKEEQRRQHMAEHERRLLELRRPHRRH